MKKLLLVPVLTAALLALLAAPAFASPKTFYVHPSGGNDTHNIQKAFNAAVKAGPGSTVQLSAGHFYTNTILVRNFHGCFKGAGEGRTVIDCLRGLDPSLPGVTLLSAPDLMPFTFLVGFVGGHISVSDMSLHITAFSPVDAASNGGSDFLQAIVVVIGKPHASSAFDRVSITAGAGNDGGLNADEDLIITGYAPTDQNGNPTSFPAIHGCQSVSDCSFVGHDGIQVQGLTNGKLSIRGSVFDDTALGCLLDDSAGGSQIVVSHNRMTCREWASVILYQGWDASGNGDPTLLPPLPAPHYLICDNHMLASTITFAGTLFAGNGVYAEDDSPSYGAPYRLDAIIAHNTIAVATEGWSDGISGVCGQGMRVLGNHISGVAFAGIDVGMNSDFGLPSAPDSGWKIIGNDLSGLTATGDQYGLSTAQIRLGSDADHCLVVGGCRSTTVLDWGTDDTLINVTRLPLPATASASPMGQTKRMLMKGDLP